MGAPAAPESCHHPPWYRHQVGRTLAIELIRRRSASRKAETLLERPSLAEPMDTMAKAAKRKVERAEEPSPKSLMARLAALQAEFAAKLQKQEKK